MGSAIITEKKGHVFIIRMNLPATMNALEKDLIISLKDALRQFRDDGESLVAVLTGQGKAFCAGGSLLEMKKGMNACAGMEFMKDANEIIQLIVGIRKTIIAAVNGAAVGAGCNIAIACDLASPHRTRSSGRSSERWVWCQIWAGCITSRGWWECTGQRN